MKGSSSSYPIKRFDENFAKDRRGERSTLSREIGTLLAVTFTFWARMMTFESSFPLSFF